MTILVCFKDLSNAYQAMCYHISGVYIAPSKRTRVEGRFGGVFAAYQRN